MNKRFVFLACFLFVGVVELFFVSGFTVSDGSITGNVVTGDVITGESITGEAITGSATQQDTNASIQIENEVAPELGPINDTFFFCEGNSSSISFNATDVNGGVLQIDLNPKDPFFVFPIFFTGQTFVTSEIFSGALAKSDVGFYEETVSIDDGGLSDSKDFNITVIEINNFPNISTIGVQTVFTQGESSEFFKEVEISDTESGNQNSGNLSINLTFKDGVTPFFNISGSGVMNFTANSSFLGTNNESVVYNLTVCATDTSLASPHQNISDFCGQDGSNRTTCEDFSLTVTGDNREPNITSNGPAALNFSVSGTESTVFSISKNDPDGTIPDTSWYVDDVLTEFDSGSASDTFSYSFGCGVSGDHIVRVDITDGVANDSLQWNVTVDFVTCPVQTTGGALGGSGGLNKPFCTVKWACNDWRGCNSVSDSLLEGNLGGEDFRLVQEGCDLENWDERTCGFQRRVCTDINSCDFDLFKPDEIQECFFTATPSCSDGVKNCHSGSCEFLVDCGGPCNACPTCSDGLQNQGEEGIDCGGPCPKECAGLAPYQQSELVGFAKRTFELVRNTSYGVVFFLLLLVVLVVKYIQIMSSRKKVKAQSSLQSSTTQFWSPDFSGRSNR